MHGQTLHSGLEPRREQRKQLEESAVGVAHDLRNLLHPLDLRLQILARETLTVEARESVAIMRRIVRDGVETLDLLLRFTGTARLEPEVVALDELALEAIAICDPRACVAPNGRPRIVADCGEHDCVVVRRADALNAVVNLIANAIDTRCTQVWVSTGSSAREAWIRVADDGPGMTEDVAKHAFEPYFTTKDDRGTGLGLARVDAFVRRNGGRVALDTALHIGTAVTIVLPRHGQREDA